MFNGAALTFAHYGCADENDRKNHEIVDYTHASREPDRVKILIEQCANDGINRNSRICITLFQKARGLTRYDFVDISGPHGGVGHSGRIHINLYRWTAICQKVSLEARWYFQNERICSFVQKTIDIRSIDLPRCLKIRRLQSILYSAGQCRLVGINNGDTRIVYVDLHGVSFGVDRSREFEGDKGDHHDIA